MTIGQYIALRQPNVFRKLLELMTGGKVQCKKVKESKSKEIKINRYIDSLMKEVPGFYKDDRLPR